MKVLIIILSVVAVLYGAVLAFAYFFADLLIFHPPARTYVKTSEHFFFKNDDGSELVGVFLKAENPKLNIVYCHGNGEDLGMIYPSLHAFRQNGYNVFSYDYNGYGYSSGKPTEAKLYKSAEAAWKCASQRFGFTSQDTVLMGFSLGSVVAFHISTLAENWRGAIIAGGIAKGSMTIFPINVVPWKLLDNQSKVAKFKSPILFLHGDSDIIVAPRNAKMNYEVARCPKKLVMLEGYNHNDIFSSPKFWEEIRTFLEQLQK